MCWPYGSALLNCRDLWCARHRWCCKLIVKNTGNCFNDLVKLWYCMIHFSGKNFEIAMLIKFCPYTSIGCHCSWFILFKRQPFFNQVYTLYFHYTPPYLISVWVKYQFSVLKTFLAAALYVFLFLMHIFFITQRNITIA